MHACIRRAASVHWPVFRESVSLFFLRNCHENRHSPRIQKSGVSGYIFGFFHPDPLNNQKQRNHQVGRRSGIPIDQGRSFQRVTSFLHRQAQDAGLRWPSGPIQKALRQVRDSPGPQRRHLFVKKTRAGTAVTGLFFGGTIFSISFTKSMINK